MIQCRQQAVVRRSEKLTFSHNYHFAVGATGVTLVSWRPSADLDGSLTAGLLLLTHGTWFCHGGYTKCYVIIILLACMKQRCHLVRHLFNIKNCPYFYCFGQTFVLVRPQMYGLIFMDIIYSQRCPLVTSLFPGLMGGWQAGRQLDEATWDWGRSSSLSNPEYWHLETPLPIKN